MENNTLQVAENSRFQVWLGRAIAGLHKIDPYNKVTSIVGMSCIFLMSALIFADVFLRYVIHHAITGSVDMIQMILVIGVFMGIAQAQHLHAHVNADLVLTQLKTKPRLILTTLTNLLSIGIFALLTWRTCLFAIQSLNHHKVTQTLSLPWWPFAFLVFLGCAALLIVLLRDLLNNIQEGLKDHFDARQWLLMFGIPAIVIAIIALWMFGPGIEIKPAIVGCIGMALFFLFFFAGMPIAFVMYMVSFIGVTYITGLKASFDILGSVPFTATASFTWAALALFILMAFICFVGDLGRDLFDTAHKWIGHLPGGLAVATIAASTALAAIVGDPSTPTVATGTVAIPEMRKFKYQDKLAVGAILGGGTIGAMIPPSLGFIIYGLLADVPIGYLFIAGIIPGLVLALAFAVYIAIHCHFNSSLGPPGAKYSWKERLISLKSALPVLILFLVVIGGIYMGVFTPSEGGGVGAFGAFIIVLAMRRLTWKRFTTAVSLSGRLIAQGFMMISGASALSYFLSLSRLPTALVNYITALDIPSIVIIIIMLLVYLVLGCVMDGIPVLLLTAPVFASMCNAMGYDPIWVGVIIILTSNIGFITPPYAGSIFMLKATFPDIPLTTMYRGVIPFVIVSIVVVGIVVAFPSLATWLPYLIK